MNQPTKESFWKDVASHQLTVVMDNGIHRHLTLSAPNTWNQHFHIVTWPGYLAFSGDMGSYVFSRVPDMFEFFRKQNINPQYWGEKLEAVDRSSGHKEFSIEKWKAAIKNDFDEWEFDSEKEKQDAWEDVKFWILDTDLYGISQEKAISIVYDYKYKDRYFADFWDHNLEDYTYRFLWCCYAIQWAIEKYDMEIKIDSNS